MIRQKTVAILSIAVALLGAIACGDSEEIPVTTPNTNTGQTSYDYDSFHQVQTKMYDMFKKLGYLNTTKAYSPLAGEIIKIEYAEGWPEQSVVLTLNSEKSSTAALVFDKSSTDDVIGERLSTTTISIVDEYLQVVNTADGYSTTVKYKIEGDEIDGYQNGVLYTKYVAASLLGVEDQADIVHRYKNAGTGEFGGNDRYISNFKLTLK